jgi:hypothetical protein
MRTEGAGDGVVTVEDVTNAIVLVIRGDKEKVEGEEEQEDEVHETRRRFEFDPAREDEEYPDWRPEMYSPPSSEDEWGAPEPSSMAAAERRRLEFLREYDTMISL